MVYTQRQTNKHTHTSHQPVETVVPFPGEINSSDLWPVTSRPRVDLRYPISSEKLQRLGWRAQVTWAEGIRRTGTQCLTHTEPCTLSPVHAHNHLWNPGPHTLHPRTGRMSVPSPCTAEIIPLVQGSPTCPYTDIRVRGETCQCPWQHFHVIEHIFWIGLFDFA